jgi:tetratricopeptide (TPR) repeat protein
MDNITGCGPSSSSYAFLMMNIGIVYGGKGQLDRTLEYSINSQSIYDRLGLQNIAGYANLMYNMAALYEKQGQLDTAGRCYRIAYDIYARVDSSVKWRDQALKNAERLGY